MTVTTLVTVAYSEEGLGPACLLSSHTPTPRARGWAFGKVAACLCLESLFCFVCLRFPSWESSGNSSGLRVVREGQVIHSARAQTWPHNRGSRETHGLASSVCAVHMPMPAQ